MGRGAISPNSFNPVDPEKWFRELLVIDSSDRPLFSGAREIVARRVPTGYVFARVGVLSHD
jgi:hypothetical protein